MDDLTKQRMLRAARESRQRAAAQMRLVAGKFNDAADALMRGEQTDSALELMVYTAEHLKGLEQYQSQESALTALDVPIK